MMIIPSIILACAIIDIIITIYVAVRKASENQKWLILTCAIAAAAQILYYNELKVSDFTVKCDMDSLVFMLKGFSVVTFFQFVFTYCERKLNHILSTCMILFAFFAGTLSVTNSMTHLINTPYSIEENQYGTFLFMKYHWPYHLIATFYVGLAIASVILLLQKLVSSRGVERKKVIYLLVSIACPLIGVGIRFAGLSSQIDSLAISFTIGLLVITYMIMRYGLTDATNVAVDDIIFNSENGLIVVDNSYNILYVNPVVLQNNPNLIKDSKEHFEEFKGMFQQKEMVIQRDGYDFEVKISDLYERRLLIGHMAWIYDMTNINKYTKEIIRLKHEADAANAAKSQFLADMSHEIRTPMNAIIGFSGLMLEEENTHSLQSYAKDINDSANILLSLINKILDISRIESGKMEIRENTYNVRGVISTVSNVIGYIASNKGLHYQENIEDSVPMFLFGANDSIYEILINLLNNAVKYTPHGYVSLSVNYRKEDEKKGYLDFEIADSGQGMSQESVDSIFEKFSRVENEENKNIEGTGLGMSIVKGLLDLMNGSIRIESKLGEGTIVYVTIPQRFADESSMNKLSDTTKVNPKFIQIPDAKILVVDDNELNLRVIKSIFKKIGNEINTCTSGVEALKRVKANHYDLIFMDQMMPEMDGIETMEKIRKLQGHNEDKIVLLTANAIYGVREQMLEKGFDGFLTKPISMSELYSTLVELLPSDKISLADNKTTIDNFSSKKTPDSVGLLQVGFGIENCGGSESDYRDILSYLCEASDERIHTLESLFSSEDWETYTINVHGLKSSTRSVGGISLSDKAKELELAGKAGDIEFIKEQHQNLMDLFKQTIENIRDYLGNNPGSSNAKPSDAISSEDLNLILSNISHLIDEFQLNDASDVATELLAFDIDDTLRQKVEALKVCLDSFDYEGSISAMSQIQQ